MKTLNLLFLPLLFLNQAQAQIKKTKYNIISLGYETWFPRRLPANFGTTFPYTVTDAATGGVTTQTFTGATSGQVARTVSAADLFDLAFVRKHYAIDIGVGINTELHNSIDFFMKGGGRYVLPFGPMLLLEPGIDFYYLTGQGTKLGTIDNKGKEIGLFGYTAQDNWDYTDPDSYATYHYTADHIDVIYRGKGFLAAPKLIVATRPMGKFSFSVEAGWMIQLKQTTTMAFVQEDDSGDSNDAGKVSLPQNGYMGGPYAGINMGFVFVPRYLRGLQQK
jgi:hypothetical protein